VIHDEGRVVILFGKRLKGNEKVSIQVSIHSFMQMAADGAGEARRRRGGEVRQEGRMRWLRFSKKVNSLQNLTSSID
jgi:hypothetical protein